MTALPTSPPVDDDHVDVTVLRLERDRRAVVDRVGHSLVPVDHALVFEDARDERAGRIPGEDQRLATRQGELHRKPQLRDARRAVLGITRVLSDRQPVQHRLTTVPALNAQGLSLVAHGDLLVSPSRHASAALAAVRGAVAA